ncbi:MAG: hypothetical protein Q9186_000577 [Xanthomendoza sp. 1 TL-2023]
MLLIFVSISTLTFFLTWVSLSQSHSKYYAAAGSAASTEESRFRSLFSFRTPSALFPSSAIISLTDDNSTFFLSRPADFGPSLPPNGLSAQLWVGSGFGDDSLGRGLSADTEGELGCSDVPGWRTGRKHHQGDSQFEPSTQLGLDRPSSNHDTSSKGEQSKVSVQDSPPPRDHDRGIPAEEDGTDDHLHHPLPPSRVSKPAAPGRAADVDRTRSEQPPQHADIQSLQESAEISGKLVLLSRGGCGFLEKVKWVQRRGGVGLIVGDNTRGGALVTMYARGDTSNVTIPALFTSRTTAHLLSSLIPPEGPDKEDTIVNTAHPAGANTRQGDDRPTFTPTAFIPKQTLTMPAKAGARPDDEVTTRFQRHERKRGWFRSLFGSQAGKEEESEGGATEDSRRPPSSGRLTWVNEQWTESAIAPSQGKEKAAIKDTNAGKSSPDNSGSHAPPGDGFEIGVHDWRDPDLVGAETAKSSTSTISRTSTKLPTSSGLNDSERVGPGSFTELAGGSITPGSGEYGRPGVASPSQQKAPSGSSATLQGSHEQRQRQSWLGRVLWGSRSGQAGVPYGSEDSTSSKAKEGSSSNDPSSREDHEGLWVTLTPTTVSTSPFFDTLLVLVVSPLITLTVVYSLLLIRSRIRRRRWRAPKSVVERLPIRTYHTMSCSSRTSSSQLGPPSPSSPTSPLLQSSPLSVTSRSRPRSHTTSGVGDAVAESLDKATAKASLKQREMNTTIASGTARRQYHGKQVECVNAMAHYAPPYMSNLQRRRSPLYGQTNQTIVQDIQVQAAETRNESPTAAIPIPRDPGDLERGDDMAATLVNDAPEASSARRGWRGLASFSLSAFSGEAAWRRAQADRNSIAFATALRPHPQRHLDEASEQNIQQQPSSIACHKMRRFGSDQIAVNFNPYGPSYQGPYYRPPPRAPYSHIQIVPKPDNLHDNENRGQQVTFRKPSYSEEAENSMVSAAPISSMPLPPKPTASLANMTSGTTFAAKARAAELNAVRARRAMKDVDEEDNLAFMPAATSGPIKLNKPRTRGKGWRPLNLDEIPEATAEPEHPQYHHQPTDSSKGQHNQPQQLSHYSHDVPATATQHSANDMVARSTYIDQDHQRLQSMQQARLQFTRMALQPENSRFVNPDVPTLASQYNAPIRRSPEQMVQQRKLPEDDPFMDMPQTAFRLPSLNVDYRPLSDTDTALRSNNTTPPAVAGAMDYEFKFPTEHHERRSIPLPPGLPVPSTYTTGPSNEETTSATRREPPPTADVHQRDPKPYTSFARSSGNEDKGTREKLLQNLHLVLDRSKAAADAPSSTRTVLYDPIAQDTTVSTFAHGPTVSQSGEDILTTSDPLPWKDRRVDIYNMVPPASIAPRFTGNRPPVAQISEFGGNAYIRSLVEQPSSAAERQKETDAWWYHDGRGQEYVRRYLEQVAAEHRMMKSMQDYESMKRSLERQANFRDDRSDSSHISTGAEAPLAADAFNRLMGPVVANLRGYADDIGQSYFNKFTKAAAWAVDGSVEGNKSFFGEDWGKPPSRVGRDPRYRPTFHEGRYTAFEPTDGRVSGRGW